MPRTACQAPAPADGGGNGEGPPPLGWEALTSFRRRSALLDGGRGRVFDQPAAVVLELR